MNQRLSLLTAALLLSGASSAFAASSTDLSVTGIITPAACTPTLSAGGIADHGKHSVQDLKPDRSTVLPTVTLQMAVNCDHATPYAIAPLDNRPDTSINGNYFGLGMINTSEKLGYFRVIPRNVMADNVTAQAILSNDGGTTWLKEGSTVFWGAKNLWAVGAIGPVTTPMWIKDLTLDLVVSTGIARTDSLTLTDEVPIDGSAVLQIDYL